MELKPNLGALHHISLPLSPALKTYLSYLGAFNLTALRSGSVLERRRSPVSTASKGPQGLQVEARQGQAR